jgi:glycerol-1-phosphate dehydrogenase [NAD(P)+]
MAGHCLIEDLVAGRWRDPTTGRPVRLPTRAIVIAQSLDGGEAELIAPLALGERLAVVGDRNTFDALGRRVARSLAAIAAVDDVVLEAPRADLATVDELRARTAAAAALIAVGSGTLSDVCKYLAHESGRPYAVFATAPSMNGYLTGTASLAQGGHKSSLPARPPAAALFDLEVLRLAPASATRSAAPPPRPTGCWGTICAMRHIPRRRICCKSRVSRFCSAIALRWSGAMRTRSRR